MDGELTTSSHREPKSFDYRCSNNIISPRNSKWLQQNMTVYSRSSYSEFNLDIDVKVKEVVTLIEEDAYSFNRKAEMYFRKRPVLVKLIEELYRAYRVLGERYNYINKELEWAQREMKKAFPDKVPFGMIEDAPSSSSPNPQILKFLQTSEISQITCPMNHYVDPSEVVKKENKIRNLKKTLVAKHGEKDNIFLKYINTVKKLADLEEELNFAQMGSRGISEQISEAKSEVQRLKEAITKVEVERDSAFLHQKELIRRISIFEQRISQVREEGPKMEIRSKCLENEVSKLETEKHTSFFKYKCCLEKIADLEQRIPLAENEEQKLRNDLDQLNNEKNLLAIEYDYCLEKVSNLEKENESFSEIREVVQILKGFNINQNGIEKEEEISLSKEDLRSRVLKLKGIKDEHINVLKEDIEDLKEKYHYLMEKILNKECVGSSIKALKDENSNRVCKENKEEKEALLNKKAVIEKSFQWLNENKLAFTSEKAALLSQLRNITYCVEKLNEKTTVLENPLYVADIGLESLKTKSENLEELFESHDNGKFNFFYERCKVSVSLDDVKNRLGSLENKFSESERKCIIMEKEREPTLAQVEHVKVSLGLERRELSSLEILSEARLACLEKHLRFLQEEFKWSKMEFDEEVGRAVSAHFEIFILHITIQDLVIKNQSLSSECEKYIESSKLRENLVLELERENLEQQVEIELLINEIEKLKGDIFKVFNSLEFSPGNKLDIITGMELVHVHRIIEYIKDMKITLLSYEDDMQKLLIENSILLALLSELKHQGTEITRDKKLLNKEFENVTEQLMIVQKDNHELIEVNKELKSEIKKEEQNGEKLRAEIEKLGIHQEHMERDYVKLKEEYSQALGENSYLMKNIVEPKNEKRLVEEENDFIIADVLVLDNLCTVFKNFGVEKAMEIDSISKDLQNIQMANRDLEKEVSLLKKKIEIEEMEKLSLRDSVKKMEKEIYEVKDLNNQLRLGISEEMKIICQKEMEVYLAEEKIKNTENLNSELCKTMEKLKRKLEETEISKLNVDREIIKISEKNKNQGEEIIFLREVNKSLSLEIDEKKNDIEDLTDQIRNEISAETVTLCQKDIEFSFEIIELAEENENQSKKKQFLRGNNRNLNTELEEMKKESKLWEAEAYNFDLQISKAYEVVLENKVRELFSLCENMGNENASKSVEMEKMKEKIDSMETEISCFKGQLCLYAPAINSIRENMVLLEQKVLDQPELRVDNVNESKDVMEPEDQGEEPVLIIPNRIKELHDLQTRIKSLEKFVSEGNRRVATKKNTFIELEPDKNNEMEDLIQTKNDFSLPLLLDENEWSVDKIEVPTEENSLNLGTMALAKKESEKTERLHLEVWNIRNMFSKLENVKKNRGKIRFLKRTSIVVKSFFRIWRRSGHTRRKRKSIFRCCRPSSNGYVEGHR